MTKLDNLKKKVDQSKAERKRLEDEISRLKEQIASLDAEAEAAAEGGAVEAYIKADGEKKRLEQTLYVMERQAAKMARPVSDDEIIDAWRQYAAEHDKQLERMIQDYEKSRRALYDRFREIVSFQNEALRDRANVGALFEDVDANNPDDDGRFARLPIRHIEKAVESGVYMRNVPEITFFSQTGNASQDDQSLFASVIRMHKPR